MLKLYYVPQTRAFRPRWLLEEMGVPYELVRLDPKQGENKTPEYLALNPTGHVPTLVDGDQAIYESAAICMHLADKYPDKGLAPAPGTPERAAYYQWISFAVSELEARTAIVYYHVTGLPEAERVPAVLPWARQRFAYHAAVLEAHLESRPFVLGETFSAADVMVGSVVGWARFQGLLEEFPTILAYSKRLAERPAHKRARAD